MTFDPDNKANPSQAAWMIFCFTLLITIPIWMPYCVTDKVKDCTYYCETTEKKQFIEVDKSGWLPSCHCGRSLNFKPVEIHFP